MSFLGDGFLAIWFDIVPEYDEDYNEWHTKEHMPERLGVPDFFVSRRYKKLDATPARYFTLYEGRNVEVFRSKAYLERLNDPTPWTQRVMPAFRRFMRGACRIVSSESLGVAGALATITIELKPGTQYDTEEMKRLTKSLFECKGITGVHLGINDQEVTGVKAQEKELRKNTEESTFDLILLVEAHSQDELNAHHTYIETAVKNLSFRKELCIENYQLTNLLALD